MEDYFNDTIHQLEDIVEKLHYEKRKEAYNALNTVIDKLFLLFQDISKDADKAKMIPDLNNQLGQCLDAMEKQDDILMADILEYEIIPRLLELKSPE